MKTALIVTSSALGDGSVSSRLAARLADRLREAAPGVRLVRRDVGAHPVPHLAPETVGGIRGEPATEAERAARALSDRLIAELEAADLVVIASPMYNFGMSSTLKAWFDHVLRAGATFRYTAAGPEGLLRGKRALVIETRGGRYGEGPAAGLDHQEPHLRTLLGFVGIEDVAFVRAEGLAMGADAADAAVAAAAARLAGLAGEERALAA